MFAVSNVENHENSFIISTSTEENLYNILTKETDQIRQDLLHIHENGRELYNDFRNARIV